MSIQFYKVLEIVQSLDKAEKLALIATLSSELADDELHSFDKEEWSEIKNRIDHVDLGSISTRPWEDFRKTLFDKYGV